MFEKKRKGTDINQSQMAPEEMNEDFDLPGKEKEIGRQVLGKKNKRLKVKDIPKNGGGVQVVDGYGCWQTPSLVIMENIVSRLDLLDRIRLRIVCKYWSSIAMRRDIRSTAPPFPWLVLSQRSPDYLEFSIPSEGRVIDLPKRIRGWFHSSSKGWLIMVKEETSRVILLNPVSRDKHKLPSLSKIPSFEKLGRRKGDNYYLREIALSSSTISECTVAAIFSSMEIGVCRPGEKSWSIFPMLDCTIESPLDILFTSSGMLYVLVENYEIKNGGVVTRTLCFEDGDELELKLVYDKKEKSRKDLFHSCGGTVEDISYLIESATRNEVLLIHQIRNQAVMTDFDRIQWTHNFLVYKIDQGNDRIFNKKQSLGNQILFISSRGSSLSFPVSSSKGLKANCIHFVELGVRDRVFRRDYRHGSGTSQVFYLDGRKFENSVNSEMWGLSWWSPTV
ncbi:uncharacterized protein LOC126634520 [Malus sylvestris]|uniref:uncharacterized protein LOC126634520 n=1 Tax=Malus sylvestris TaxID=3752 RepID=UPI0021AC249D|nr:uncharacterized protein LOC126634520 [Malus sylvestris]